MTEGELKRVKCDWCGVLTDCRQWRDTHYLVCLKCAIQSFNEASDE